MEHSFLAFLLLWQPQKPPKMLLLREGTPRDSMKVCNRGGGTPGENFSSPLMEIFHGIQSTHPLKIRGMNLGLTLSENSAQELH